VKSGSWENVLRVALWSAEVPGRWCSAIQCASLCQRDKKTGNVCDKIGQIKRGRMTNAEDKTGRSYESVAQGIFQLLVDLDSPRRISLQHDVILQGKTATHQIDVYWKFEMAGVEYETIVQAKDWSKPVEQDKLFCFKAVLDDLPGQPRGIFVTRSGYQSGAANYAKAHGIILYELDVAPPNNVTVETLGWAQCSIVMAPLRGSPKTEEIAAQDQYALAWKWTVFTPRVSTLRLQRDKTWLEQNPIDPNFDILKFEVPAIPLSDIVLYDESHAVTRNVEQVLREEIADMRAEKIDTKQLLHTFERLTFVGPPVTPAYIKVNSLSANIEIESTALPRRFGNSKFVEFVLREITSGKTQSFFRQKE
jgi:hypothetical protein